jgi:hypothetical protein
MKKYEIASSSRSRGTPRNDAVGGASLDFVVENEVVKLLL